MLILAGAVLLSSSMLLECGPSVSPETTHAIIQVESGGNPFAIGDNTDRRSYSPKNKEEAVKLASRLLLLGHSIDMGLMQVNSCHISSMKLSLEDLFDPCKNIRTGTTILSDFYRRYKTEDPLQSLFKALSAYNTGQAWRGAGYINRILEAAGAGYRVVPPEPGEIPSAVSPNKARSTQESAASSPLFFDNVSTSMTAREP